MVQDGRYWIWLECFSFFSDWRDWSIRLRYYALCLPQSTQIYSQYVVQKKKSKEKKWKKMDEWLCIVRTFCCCGRWQTLKERMRRTFISFGIYLCEYVSSNAFVVFTQHCQRFDRWPFHFVTFYWHSKITTEKNGTICSTLRHKSSNPLTTACHRLHECSIDKQLRKHCVHGNQPVIDWQ